MDLNSNNYCSVGSVLSEVPQVPQVGTQSALNLNMQEIYKSTFRQCLEQCCLHFQTAVQMLFGMIVLADGTHAMVVGAPPEVQMKKYSLS
jgi:hypothetical protein